MKTKIYCAYGSNMNLQQMSYRCPHAKIIGTGIIKGYELLFRGGDGNAVATIEPRIRSSVSAVLFEITPTCEKNLDIYEGFPRLYRKKLVTVELNNGRKMRAMAYVINYGKIGLPSPYYYNVILQGYAQNGINPSPLEKAINKCRKGNS